MLKKTVSILSLFGSLGTLFCCALPVALVSLGMGATFASITSSFPQIVWLTEKKELLFVITGGLFLLSWASIKYSEKAACPINQKDNCEQGKSLSKRILFISLFIYVIGLTFSYIVPEIIYG